MSSQTIGAYGTEALDRPLHPMTIARRDLLPHDVEIEVLYCGICHSDLHQVKNDFGATMLPIVPGHEIVGRVTRLGSDAQKFQVGDLAAIGCIVDSCGTCPSCDHGEEQFCETGVTFSFNSPDKHLGGATYGGFAETYVCDERYVLRMPSSLNLSAAAPLLCAGITVYSPLKHWKTGPGKVVGILGIGGLGHVAVKIAKAMGARVVVLTTSESKVADARRLGADEAVLTTDHGQMGRFLRGFDLILDTVSAKHDVNGYLRLLKPDGSLVLVGLPPAPLEVGAFFLVGGRKSLSGSNIGGIAETQEMLDFCAQHRIEADVELIGVDQINEAFARLERGDVKYRFVVDLSTLKNASVG